MALLIISCMLIPKMCLYFTSSSACLWLRVTLIWVFLLIYIFKVFLGSFWVFIRVFLGFSEGFIRVLPGNNMLQWPMLIGLGTFYLRGFSPCNQQSPINGNNFLPPSLKKGNPFFRSSQKQVVLRLNSFLASYSEM
jgi:hypothetical protein